MDNRSKILACALKLFYQKGYDAVGIQEICQEAEITKPTLYHYFGSKYGLLEKVLETEYTPLFDKIAAAIASEDSIEQQLYNLAEVLFDFAYENPKGYMLLMALSYSAKENEVYHAVKPYISALYERTVRMFEKAGNQLGNMNGRQEQFAIGFLGIINHYIMFLGYTEETGVVAAISPEKKRSLIHQFMYGIWT